MSLWCQNNSIRESSRDKENIIIIICWFDCLSAPAKLLSSVRPQRHVIPECLTEQVCHAL